MPKGKDKESCGGTPRNDGSGKGVGNKGTASQPQKTESKGTKNK